MITPGDIDTDKSHSIECSHIQEEVYHKVKAAAVFKKCLTMAIVLFRQQKPYLLSFNSATPKPYSEMSAQRWPHTSYLATSQEVFVVTGRFK
jgi:hypothetical protein